MEEKIEENRQQKENGEEKDGNQKYQRVWG
jgi:hypothetical protein